MKYTKTSIFIILFWFSFFSSVLAVTPGDALWAKTTISGNESVGFRAVTSDSNGNIYVAGSLGE